MMTADLQNPLQEQRRRFLFWQEHEKRKKNLALFRSSIWLIHCSLLADKGNASTWYIEESKTRRKEGKLAIIAVLAG